MFLVSLAANCWLTVPFTVQQHAHLDSCMPESDASSRPRTELRFRKVCDIHEATLLETSVNGFFRVARRLGHTKLDQVGIGLGVFPG